MLGALAQARTISGVETNASESAERDPFDFGDEQATADGAALSTGKHKRADGESGSERKRRKRSTRDNMAKLLKRVCVLCGC